MTVREVAKIAATEGVKKYAQATVRTPARMPAGKDVAGNVQAIVPMNVENGLVQVGVLVHVQMIAQFNVEVRVRDIVGVHVRGLVKG